MKHLPSPHSLAAASTVPLWSGHWEVETGILGLGKPWIYPVILGSLVHLSTLSPGRVRRTHLYNPKSQGPKGLGELFPRCLYTACLHEGVRRSW